MKLNVFNPEHDIALASNLSNFTAPHAGRQMRADLGYLPALWAKDDEAVLVDSVEYARRHYGRLRNRAGGGSPLFVDKTQLKGLPITDVEPWGWDLALRAQLLRWGVQCVPDEEYIALVRQLSHRRTAARLLPQLRFDGTTGEAFECTDPAEVEALLARYGQVVLKAPWSSSGRGLRFLSTAHTPLVMQMGWVNNIIKTQGSVMAEPYYQKVKDFGMEFQVNTDGTIHYEGLSLFHTKNGAYIGNVIATESQKWEMISRYIPVELLELIKQTICDKLLLGDYVGPFGIDMMIVGADRHFLLHPCVEINLRCTMGHAALSVKPDDNGIIRVMRIELFDKYKLKLQKL